MGRLLKLIASMLVLAAGGGAALAAASAPARTASQMIVCPLERGATVPTCCGPPIVTNSVEPAYPCCGPVVTTCCGTPQPSICPVGLTLSSSPDPSIAGRKVTLTGHWSGDASGQAVVLWQKLPGAKHFKDVARTKTAFSGGFRFVRKGVKTNRKWYVSVGTERSATIDQRVKPG
jgi:hypothetical protein